MNIDSVLKKPRAETFLVLGQARKKSEQQATPCKNSTQSSRTRLSSKSYPFSTPSTAEFGARETLCSFRTRLQRWRSNRTFPAPSKLDMNCFINQRLQIEDALFPTTCHEFKVLLAAIRNARSCAEHEAGVTLTRQRQKLNSINEAVARAPPCLRHGVAGF